MTQSLPPARTTFECLQSGSRRRQMPDCKNGVDMEGIPVVVLGRLPTSKSLPTANRVDAS